jgi:hypothetical protein
LAKFAAIRRASSLVSRLVAEQRCGAPRCPQVGDKRKPLAQARNDVNDPEQTLGESNYSITSSASRQVVALLTATFALVIIVTTSLNPGHVLAAAKNG